MKKKSQDGYRVLRGINWPDGTNDPGGEKRAEEGEVRSDLPAEHVAQWIDIGAIEPADMSGAPAAEEV